MPMRVNFKYILVVVTLGCASVHAFSSRPKPSFSSRQSWRRQTIPNSRIVLSSSSEGGSKEDEIAKLEEQLRRLREEAEAEETSNQQLENEGATATGLANTNSADYVGRGPAKRPVTPMEEMVTEAWKSEDLAEEEQEGGGIIPKVLGAIAVVVLLAVFAQAPVGQEDLSKYQGVKNPATQIDLGDLNPSRPSD